MDMQRELEIIKAMFSRSAGIFEKTIDGIPDEQWFQQPAEESNHLMWITGHVVVHRAVVPKILGMQWSAPWEKLFSRGSIRAGQQNYPDPAAIRGAWKEVSQKLATALENASSEQLGDPAPRGMPSDDGTMLGAISFFCLHEIYHVGQMGYLRKWLGHAQALG
jgi:DinB superfamily